MVQFQIAEIVALAVTYLINLPFGYWRSKTKNKSREWVLAIHSPVPFVFLVRYLSGVPVQHIPLFFVSFFLGQFTGGKIKLKLEKKYAPLTKCLVLDLSRYLKSHMI